MNGGFDMLRWPERSRWWAMCWVLLSLSACSQAVHVGPFRPLAEQGESLSVADDGSVTFVRQRLEIRLRPVAPEELSRQFAAQSDGGVKATNPYLITDRRVPADQASARFTVFALAVKNYAFPKVLIDPSQITLLSPNGRKYWSLTLPQLESYFRAYAVGFRGNEFLRHKERVDLLRKTLFRAEPVFSGQEGDGFVVFPLVHADVGEIQVIVKDAALRFDVRDEPTETVDIAYRFGRELAVGEDVR